MVGSRTRTVKPIRSIDGIDASTIGKARRDRQTPSGTAATRRSSACASLKAGGDGWDHRATITRAESGTTIGDGVGVASARAATDDSS